MRKQNKKQEKQYRGKDEKKNVKYKWELGEKKDKYLKNEVEGWNEEIRKSKEENKTKPWAT